MKWFSRRLNPSLVVFSILCALIGATSTSKSTPKISEPVHVIDETQSNSQISAFKTVLAPDKLTQDKQAAYLDTIQGYIKETYKLTARQCVGINFLGKDKYKQVPVETIEFGLPDSRWETSQEDWVIRWVKFNCAVELQRRHMEVHRIEGLLSAYGNAHVALALLSYDKMHHKYAVDFLLRKNQEFLNGRAKACN